MFSQTLQDAKKAPLFQLYKRRYLKDKNLIIITFDGLRKFLQDYLFEDFRPIFLTSIEEVDIDIINRFLVIFLRLLTFSYRYQSNFFYI